MLSQEALAQQEAMSSVETSAKDASAFSSFETEKVVPSFFRCAVDLVLF